MAYPGTSSDLPIREVEVRVHGEPQVVTRWSRMGRFMEQFDQEHVGDGLAFEHRSSADSLPQPSQVGAGCAVGDARR